MFNIMGRTRQKKELEGSAEIQEIEKATEENVVEENVAEENVVKENITEENVAEESITDVDRLKEIRDNISDSNPFKLKLQRQLDEVISKI